MATYVLMCTAKLGTTPEENEGVFDSVTWVSPTQTTLPDPATTSLDVSPGDQVGFAIQVQDANGVVQNGWLTWVAVAVSAVTAPGNRKSPMADNNSPFRIGTAAKPNTVLLATNQGGTAGTFASFTPNGSQGSNGTTTALGTPLSAIYADIPPGSSTPNRRVSQYEAVITCSITNPTTGAMWQFTFDPEMDVENN